MTFIFVLILLLVILGLIVYAVFNTTKSDNNSRANAAPENKMIPMLIHLPPPSDDTVAGGRDARDVVDETISKAQIIYNIIASTVQKEKSKKIERQHISFEIIGAQGLVYFYTAAPAELTSVVEQAIVSAYPAAQLEHDVSYNIFNKIGKINGVAGGEMALREPYAFPIATYQDLKRDALQSVLNSLSALQKEDGVGIQILLRPAEDSWRKKAIDIAGQKRKGKYDNKSGFDKIAPVAKQMVTALVKPPEDSSKDGDSKEKDLSNLDRSVIDAIEDKTRYAGYETLIRIVVSSNVSQRAQAVLNSVVASFSLFDAPGKNGFKFELTRDAQQLVKDYISRAFPKTNKKMILNAVELSTLFHFPDQSNIPTSQLTRQESKQVDGPRNIPEEGLLLGYNVFRGAKKPIRLAVSDRQRHMYVVGQTGTGKSTFLENLALQDMLKGNGFAFVDPHGDTVEQLLSMVPRERTEDIIYFSPADMDHPMGLNLFEFHTPDQKDFLIQEALNMLYKLYDPQHQGIMGPRYEHLFRNAALTVMADPAGGTFVDIPKLFRDPNYVKQKLRYVKDQNVIEFWQKEMPQSQRSNDFGEVVSWFVSKFGAFLSNEMMRNIIGQPKSAFDLRDIMDNKKILLVNLSKGRTGELNSKPLGMIFVMKFQAAAMSRATIPESERVDFSLYVDEFQNFSTESFATIMSEARKYHLNLIVANQFTTQLTPEIRDAVFGNMGTITAFRIGQNDVESLTKYFQPVFEGDDLLRVPNYNTIMRTLVNGVPTQPFSMSTLPPLGNRNPHLSNALKQLSAAKYGRPKKVVEDEIFARMKTQAPARPSAGVGGASSPWQSPATSPPAATSRGEAGPSGTGPAQSTHQSKSRQGSFLDEWLQKRQQSRPATPARVSHTAGPSPSTEPLTKPSGNEQQSAGKPQDRAAKAPFHQERHMLLKHDQKTAKNDSAKPEEEAVSAKPHKVISPPGKPTGTKNITSEKIEQQEISKIADELRQDLSDGDKSKKPTNITAKQEGHIEIKAPPADATDTIYIDQEGNLVHKKKED